MSNRELRVHDYILITDISDKEYYLKIGEITNIERYPDGDVESYVVKFGYELESPVYYRYDLPNKCRILQFI